jgi:hypothetical protein
MTSLDLRRVSLQRIPLEIWDEGRRWFAELLREFEVIASQVDDATPGEVLSFVAATTENFGRFSEPASEMMQQAFDLGQETTDIELRLPAEAAPAARELWQMTLRAREFCQSGVLLTLEPSPEVLDFIRWYLDEIGGQLEGKPPTPWTHH